MSKRARQGLGFVVLAFLLWLIALALRDTTGAWRWLNLVVVVGVVLCGVYGLARLALGLIRD